MAGMEEAASPADDKWADNLLGIPEPILEFFRMEVGGFRLGDLFLCFGVILLTLILRGMVTRWFFRRLKHLAGRTRLRHDDQLLDALEKPTEWLITVVGIFIAISALPMDPEWSRVLGLVFRGMTMLIVFWGLLRSVDLAVDAVAAILGAAEAESGIHGFVPLIRKSVRIFLVVVAVVMVVDNLGYDIGGILATLGIGGLALAIAAQDTVANLYGSLALALDRPFKVGDWIMVGDNVDGDVEEIGLRSTKVRTWPKTVISIPNAVLAQENINNWSRMPKRRVKQVIGVTYSTSPETMEKIVESIRQLLLDDEGVDSDFLLVNWTDFSASSLDILVYYFTKSIKWLEHMDVRQRVNVKIAQTVEAHGSSFAFPTRTLQFDTDSLPGDSGPRLPL